MIDTTIPSLLIRIRDHADSDAWNQFCDTYGSLIFAYCRKRSLNSVDAGDVAQEVLFRVANGIRRFEYDRRKGRFRDWLSTIVHNEISRWYSKKASSVEMLAEFAGNFQDQNANIWHSHFEEYIYCEALKRSRKYFEESTWKAFDLVWCGNRQPTDVAETMNRTLEFVYQAKSRVLKRVAMEVDRLAEDTLFRLADDD